MVARVRLQTAVSDDELKRITRENPGWKVELIDGTIQMMPPTGFRTGRQNAKLTRLLEDWGERHGYAVTDSNGGYKLRTGAILSPDAALVALERVASIPEESLDDFCAVAPDVVVELLSPSDSAAALRRKCERWYRDGVRYVLLLDPNGDTEVWGESPPEFPSPDAILTVVRG